MLCILALCLAVVAANELPPGFNSPTELATVLANEPESAKESRFAQVGDAGDSITFKDPSATSAGDDEADAEFDSQIAQVESDMKKLKENIKESEECARRLEEQNAELRSLGEQKSHLEKEKEKRNLQVKLEKQMRDLSEINRMSRSLRAKFAELKRTQKIIKSKMTGTRTSLQMLDTEEEVPTSELVDHSAQLTGEVAQMQQMQAKALANEHNNVIKGITSGLKQARDVHSDSLATPFE